MKSYLDIKKLRIQNNFSQDYIAKRLKVSRPTYIKMEKGEKDITVKQSQILATLFKIPLENLKPKEDIVSVKIPTKFGNFLFNVWNQEKGQEIVFLATENLDISKPVLVRVHSECMTGETFHSYRCDCGDQKDKALEMIADHGNGIFIYLRQEGRGIGLFEKMKSYLLQDQGYDTHEANVLLGFKPDHRDYFWVKKILDYYHINQIGLITNNPSKVSELSQLGIIITERVPLVIESNIHNRKYFETKKQKFKHFFGNEESNYFYQFSYADSPNHVEQIGEFLKGKTKDPFLKICIGVYADSHIFSDKKALKNIELIFKAAGFFEGFVPILHFTFKFSADPIKDIALIREKLPFVRYLRLNDLESNHLAVLKQANKFFLVDIPLSDEMFHLLDNEYFIKEVQEKKTFIMIDNSHGRGIAQSEKSFMQKIDKLLSVGINDIALCGGFGPGSLETYFKLRNHYKINFSIDAETKLKSHDSLDIEKVKKYLLELIKHNYDQ